MRRFHHPLAVLRFVLGLTQPAFGKAVGVSGSLIEAIEAGNRSMSEELAHAIRIRFGVGASQITGEITKYGTESLPDRMFALVFAVEEWKHRAQIVNDDAISIYSEKFAAQVQGVIEAAAERNKGAAVMQRLDAWIESTLAEFGLEPTFLRKHKREPYIFRLPDRPGRLQVESSEQALARFKHDEAAPPTVHRRDTGKGTEMQIVGSALPEHVRRYFETIVGGSLEGNILTRTLIPVREQSKRPRRSAAKKAA